MKYLMDKIGNDEVSVVRKIYIPSGAHVEMGDSILEVETSKTILDIQAERGGLLFHSLEVGGSIGHGEGIFDIRDENNETDAGSDVLRISGHTAKSRSVTHQLSKRKKSEINNLFSLDHGASTSVLTILLDSAGERMVAPPFIFKGGISDILVFEAAKLLVKYKELNAYYRGDGFIEMYSEVNVGWGFDSKNNLKVLTLRNVESYSLIDLQNAVFELLKAYEFEERLPIELVVGSTVTFTDLSRTETESLIPLINGKQSLILGLTNPNKNQYRIIAAYDHRVSAGLTVANFLSELKARVLSHFREPKIIVDRDCHVCGKSMAEELSLGHRGLIKMTMANGEDGNLCRNCFEGW